MKKIWVSEVGRIMNFSSFVLYLLVYGFWGHCCFGDKNPIRIGALVDMGSWEGKVIENCITKAMDFQNLNSDCKTRVVLHMRDSKGHSFNSISAALELLENVQVDAIIIPGIDKKDLFLAQLADKANVPLLSFSSTSSADEHPYILQVGEDEATEFHGISALIKKFRWRNSVIIYEDTMDPGNVQHYLHDILLKNHMDFVLADTVSISMKDTNGQLIHVLRRLAKIKASVIIVHMSPSLASHVFVKAKVLGMMSKGYAWIITSKTMNLLEYLNTSVYESMQGVVGLKSYVSESSTLQNFSLTCRSEFHSTECEPGTRDQLHVYGSWAYDAIWALVEAMERTGLVTRSGGGVRCNLLDSSCGWDSDSGRALLSQLSHSNFVGLAGPFQLVDRKIIRETYEIVNVIGKGERRVGFWTSAHGLTKEIGQSHISSSNSNLETIIWPGISTSVPPGLLLQISGKVFRVVIPGWNRWPHLVNWHHDPRTNGTIADGFCIDVFRAALDWLHLNLSLEFVPWSNGTYNDFIYQVFLQTYDAAVGDVTIISKRLDYVDFTLPFTDLGVEVLMKRGEKDPWFFLKPLDRDLWIVSACLFLMLGVVVWLIERSVNEEFRGSLAHQVGTLLWFAISTLVYAHRENLKRSLSRFVVAIWLFVVLILTSSYTANLSSLLTVQQFKLAKSDYVGYAASFLQLNVSDNQSFGYYNRVELRPSPEEYNKALRKGRRNGGVDAIVDEIPYVKSFLAQYPQDYTTTGTSVITSGFGFAFPKGSLLVHEVSKAISGLREEGKLVELEKKWLRSRSPLVSQDTQTPTTETLSIYNFFGLFLVSGISQFIAILVFLIILLRQRLANNTRSVFRMWGMRRR